MKSGNRGIYQNDSLRPHFSESQIEIFGIFGLACLVTFTFIRPTAEEGLTIESVSIKAGYRKDVNNIFGDQLNVAL